MPNLHGLKLELLAVLGKTTFIKNMFASYAQDADLKINDVSAPTSKDEFVHSPEKLCTEIIVSDPTTQTRYSLTCLGELPLPT